MARKTYQGEHNDKERSSKRLITAVGTVLTEKGYTGLTATNIAKAAGVDRRLISLYFGSVDNLITTYIKGKDYWVEASGNAPSLFENNKGENTREILKMLLLNQLDYFYSNEEMQKIVLWQLSEQTEIMYKICEEREKLSSAFFSLADNDLKGEDIDLRAVAGLLVGGIYHMVLHAKASDSLFCEIDLNTQEGLKRIKDAVCRILNAAYKGALI